MPGSQMGWQGRAQLENLSLKQRVRMNAEVILKKWAEGIRLKNCFRARGFLYYSLQSRKKNNLKRPSAKGWEGRSSLQKGKEIDIKH